MLGFMIDYTRSYLEVLLAFRNSEVCMVVVVVVVVEIRIRNTTTDDDKNFKLLFGNFKKK